MKLYVSEDGSDEVHAAVLAADVILTCRITWVEINSALSRRARGRSADNDALGMAREAFAVDWPRYLIIDIDQALAGRAAQYAEAFALRAYDAVQLAAAKWASEQVGTACTFACFDSRLNRAASVLGMPLLGHD